MYIYISLHTHIYICIYIYTCIYGIDDHDWIQFVGPPPVAAWRRALRNCSWPAQLAQPQDCTRAREECCRQAAVVTIPECCQITKC